jgi:hypothetical protein
MPRDPITKEVDGDRYTIAIMPAGDGLRLLAGWSRLEAALSDAAAESVALDRHQSAPQWLGQREPCERLDASHIEEQAHRQTAAVHRAHAEYLLSDETVQRVLVPTLRFASVHMHGGAVIPLDQVWQSHFAGRIGSLLSVASAIKDHNFADFFGGSAGAPAVEPEAVAAQVVAAAAAASERTTTRTHGSSASSGRPSVRATARS